MNSKEKQQRALERLTGILWFFLCLFGVLTTIGFFLKRVEGPNWELYLQLGIVGGVAAMMFMGTLQLGHAFLKNEKPLSHRLMRASGFFLGIFGALLTLGSFFEMLKYPNGPFLMRIGLLGTAAALSATGLLTLGEVATMDPPEEIESNP